MMTLHTGTRLGHYEIRSQLGAGGMGEVYLADDSRLNRKVALKILPESIASDKDRLRRFEQEAYAASSLNHPNILTVYEFGAENQHHFLATEFVEGETLRERLKREGANLNEALEIVQQVAFALSAAHAAGIAHRDIKPENIMIRRDGIVKVLDFGLAKLTEKREANLDAEAETRALVQTNPGVVMGTVAYMSPEQARGKETDTRTDIWSLGVVLYEMVTRHLPFAGDTMNDSIAAILTREPPLLSQYLSDVPAELQRIVGKTLRKNREERYQHVKDLWIDLKDLRQELEFAAKLERSVPPNTSGAGEITRDADAPTQILTENKLTDATTAAVSTKDLASGNTHPTSSAEYIVGNIKRHRTGAIVALALSVIVLAGIGYGIYRLTAKRDKPALSFQTAKFTRLTTTGKASGVAISPDGKYVVHVQDDGGQQSLWTRQTATQSNVQIVAPAAVSYSGLTFSPDGNYIYYRVVSQEFSRGALFQLPTLGGTPKKLLETLGGNNISFSPDGKQLAFTREAHGKEDALMIANADGSNERKLVAHKNPPEDIGSLAWSPDGKSIAYNVLNFDTNDATLYEAQVADGSAKPLTAQRWLSILGLSWLADGSGLLMLASAEQRFVYQIWQLSYPKGEAHRLTNDLNNYQGMSLAADSGILAVVQSDTQASIWIAPVGDASRARPVTSGSGKADTYLAWTPDGRIVYQSNASGNNEIWITGADGANAKQLTANARINALPSVSPDGLYIVYASDRTGGVPHLWRMNIDGSDQRQLANGSGGEQGAQFSPDGRWLVYRTALGKWTVWKMPAEGGEPVQLTDKFSRSPTVSPDGKLVAYFYRAENAPWRIAVAPLEGGEPLKTFDVPAIPNPSLRWTPDGRAVAYIDTKNGVSNIFAQPLDGGAPKQITDFKADRIFSFDYSRDGKQLALSRGTVNNDVVLISNFK